MEEIMQGVFSFFSGSSVWVYMFIFVGKIVEVSLATLRIVLIGRGERVIGACVGVFEITIWLFITSSVLAGISSDFIKVVVFVLAFAVGNFTGSYLEELLALGLAQITVVVPDVESVKRLANIMRERGFGVTSLDAKGKEDDRYMLITTLKRKLAKEAMGIIREDCPDAVVTLSDVKAQRGGYFARPSVPRRSLFK